MYLVARPFTSFGKFYAAGDVITDISSLRNYRLKLSEGKIFFIDPLKEPLMIEKVKKLAYHAGLNPDELLIATGLKAKPEPAPQALSTNAPEVVAKPATVQKAQVTKPVSPKPLITK